MTSTPSAHGMARRPGVGPSRALLSASSGVAERPGGTQRRDLLGRVAAHLAQHLVGVLAAQRAAPEWVRVAAEAKRRGDLSLDSPSHPCPTRATTCPLRPTAGVVTVQP